MGQKDKTEKLLEDYNDVFADIFNVLVFKDSMLKEELLLAGPTESVYKAATGEYNSQFRDVDKYYLGTNKKHIPLMIVEFGVENQTTFDEYMAFRVMGYDYTSYRKQIENKKESVAPVISIVLNFSDKKYPENMGLKEYLDITELTKALPDYDKYGDYRIRCYNIAFLDDETISRFTSDFRSVAHFFKSKRLYGENYQPNNDEIKHVEALVDLISVFTNDTSYKENVKELVEQQKKGQTITMCEIRESWVRQGKEFGIELGREQGREQGRAKDVNILMKKLNFSIFQALDMLEITGSERQEVIELVNNSVVSNNI